MKAGESIDDFLDGFPTVSREQAIAFLDAAEAQIVKLVVPLILAAISTAPKGMATTIEL